MLFDVPSDPPGAHPAGNDTGAEPRQPRRKLGLVVQGGSMRGVFTAGALCGLEALGLRDAFERKHGVTSPKWADSDRDGVLTGGQHNDSRVDI